MYCLSVRDIHAAIAALNSIGVTTVNDGRDDNHIWVDEFDSRFDEIQKLLLDMR